MKIRNAYEQFFEIVPKNVFFDFGLKNIITIEKGTVSYEWKRLLNRINNSAKDLFVRDFGRNGNENQNVSKLYKEIFDVNINFDPTNNAKPKQLLQNLTEFIVNKNLENYQISHVFGNTKNVYCFTAPWNLVFIPKIIDPLTGHEAKGDFVGEFQGLFKRFIFKNSMKKLLNIII